MWPAAVELRIFWLSVNERVLLFSRANEIRGVDPRQPYYHTIPTISLQVLAPTQLDFVAKNTMIYWTDAQVNEVKRTGLTFGPTQTIIDTGKYQPKTLSEFQSYKLNLRN